MKMTEITDQVAAKTGLTKGKTREVLYHALRAIAGSEEAILPGFGKFKVQDRAARAGRNPATGERIELPATRRMVFTAAKALKDQLNPTAIS